MAGDQGVEPASDDLHRITVGCDMVPGPLAEAVAERLLSIVIGELRDSGIVVTAVRVELQGRSTAW